MKIKENPPVGIVNEITEIVFEAMVEGAIQDDGVNFVTHVMARPFVDRLVALLHPDTQEDE